MAKTIGSIVGSQILKYDNLKERNSKFLGCSLRSVMQKMNTMLVTII